MELAVVSSDQVRILINSPFRIISSDRSVQLVDDASVFRILESNEGINVELTGADVISAIVSLRDGERRTE